MPKGELRIAVGVNFPANLNQATNSYAMIWLGIAETLTRITPAGKLEPWLATTVENVDASTWRVRLRPNAMFWDGSPVDAKALAATFQYNWDQQPAADSLISKASTLTVVDALTLEIKTPQPSGSIPYALASPYFIVGKPGQNGSILTSAYRPVQFVTDQSLTLEPFTDHWAGPPPIARISIQNQTDGEARVLALQSGDLDMVWGVPPETVKTLTGDLRASVTPSWRLDLTILNISRPLFGDRAVRQATAMAVDRSTFVKAAMNGFGSPAVGLFPENAGIDAVAMQTTDSNQAKQLLDQNGWKVGSDGTRVKNGQRLAFRVYTGAETNSIAVSMQDQLKTVGYDVQVQTVQDSSIPKKTGNWDAIMSSVNTLPNGDTQYMLTRLRDSSYYIYGGYVNADYSAIVDQLGAEPDPSKRQTLSHQAQLILKDDTPYVFLAWPSLITGMNSKKVKGFIQHPNDLYFLNTDMSVSA